MSKVPWKLPENDKGTISRGETASYVITEDQKSIHNIFKATICTNILLLQRHVKFHHKQCSLGTKHTSALSKFSSAV
jgi:hypothetical protein